MQAEDRSIFVVLPWPLILKTTYPGHMGSSYFSSTVSEYRDGATKRVLVRLREPRTPDLGSTSMWSPLLCVPVAAWGAVWATHRDDALRGRRGFCG